MPRVDDIYTPSALASWLSEQVTLAEPRLIADFAAGDGALLKAARARFPDAMLLGNDLSDDAVYELKLALPDASARLGDFFDETVRQGLEEDFGRPELILLNPPFSSRGNAAFQVIVGDSVVRGSKALAFVAHALEILAPGGELVALVPVSCLTSERDASLREALKQRYQLDQLSTYSAAFQNRSVKVAAIRFSRRSEVAVTQTREPPQQHGAVPVWVVRGSTPVWKALRELSVDGAAFLHTTDVSEKIMRIPSVRTAASGKTVTGTTILLPRVGRPNRNKLSMWNLQPLLLSDCLFAMQCETKEETTSLKDKLSDNWDLVADQYGGSCAPYLTRNKLAFVLSLLGYRVRFVKSLPIGQMERDSDICHRGVAL